MVRADAAPWVDRGPVSESRQWFATRRYGVLLAMESLSNVPVQRMDSPSDQVSRISATALVLFANAVVCGVTQAMSMLHAPELPMSETVLGWGCLSAAPVTRWCATRGSVSVMPSNFTPGPAWSSMVATSPSSVGDQ